MSSCDRERRKDSKLQEFPMKREIEDLFPLSAVKLENNDLVGSVALCNNDSLFMDPEMEFKAEPDIFESSKDDIKYSHEYCASLSEDDLQSCKIEVNKEEESVKIYLVTDVKEECDKREVNKEVNQIKGEKIENNDCDLKEHYETRTRRRPFICNVCDRAFSQRSTIIKHYRIHTEEKPFKCDVCDKAFSLRNHLAKHYRAHTKERPFKCNFCDKTFLNKSNLTAHHRIHTGEKPFKCDVCDRAFSQKSSLIQHYRIHTGEKPFKCSACDKAFSQKNILTEHLKIHTGAKPFKCQVCDKAFSNKSNLFLHHRIHTGEKPFKCDVCDKAFPQRSHLTKHNNRNHAIRVQCL